MYAFAVLPIQQAHFMTVDSFTNTFGMLTVLAAVLLLKRKRRNFAKVVADNDEAPENRANIKSSGQVKEILLFLFFGIALGMATASKSMLFHLLCYCLWLNWCAICKRRLKNALNLNGEAL